MKRLIVCTIVLALFVGSVAFATNVRVLTLGENNVILRDDANIFLFPSTINNYKKLVVGEFGRTYNSDDFRDFGIHWQMGEDNPFVLGTYLHNSETIMPSPFSSINFNFWNFPLANNRIDIFGGTNLGKTPVGFHLGILGSLQNEDDDDSKDEAYFRRISLDLGATIMEGKADVTVGFASAFFTDQGTTAAGSAYDQTKSEGNVMVHFLARYFLEKNPKYTIVPHVGGSLEGAEFAYNGLVNDNPRKFQTKTWGVAEFEAGSGFVWTPTDKALCLLDVGIAVNASSVETAIAGGVTTEDETSTVTVPYFHMGFEGNVFKWMDVRFGATTNWSRITETVDNSNLDDVGDGEYFKCYSNNRTYLGFGFHWNRLHVDTYVDPNLFLDGFHFLSGQSNSMNFMISAVYDID